MQGHPFRCRRDASERSQPCFLFTCAYLFFIQEALGLKFLIIINILGKLPLSFFLCCRLRTSYIKDGSVLMFLKATVVLIILKIKKHSRLQYMFCFICIWSFNSVQLFQGPWVVEPEIMKWNLFKKKPEAMVGPEPTGLGGTHPSHNITMAPAVSTLADNSTESERPVNKNDVFEEIKSKFLNEIDKIPCKSCRDVLQSHYIKKINLVSFCWRCFIDLNYRPNCQAPRYLTKLTFFLNYSRSTMQQRAT